MDNTIDGLTIEQWREAAHKLWEMMDSIDTLSDSMRPEQTAYYRAVMTRVEERHKILASDGYELTPAEWQGPPENLDARETFHAGFYIGMSPNADPDKFEEEWQRYLEAREQRHAADGAPELVGVGVGRAGTGLPPG